MRLDYRHLAVIHFVIAAALCASCVIFACVTDEQRRSAELVELYRPTLEDAGLGWGLGRLNGVVVRQHPESDGGSWSGEGYARLFGYSGQACYSYPKERVVWVASLSSPIVCHELAHVARSDIYSVDAGECLGPGDHEYFSRVALDAKCAAVTP